MKGVFEPVTHITFVYAILIYYVYVFCYEYTTKYIWSGSQYWVYFFNDISATWNWT